MRKNDPYDHDNIQKKKKKKKQKKRKNCQREKKLESQKKMKSLDIEANFVGILPPSLDALRHRIKQNTKLNTEKINAELEKASDEIKEIEKYTFFVFRIINDELEAGLKDVKNAMISLYPKLKYSDEMIEEIKNMSHEVQQNEENNVANNENKIKEDSKDEIKEKEEEKSVESERENK
jgi:hypothetical protein